MDISRLDLNLLVALDALLLERNVTRAARRLNLSQPALSARLARLRDALGDQLLRPTSRGMVPTPRGLSLQAPLRAALQQIRDVVAANAGSDPRLASTTVFVAATDYTQLAILTRLSAALRIEAPGIRLAWRALDPARLAEQLEHGDVDLAIATPDHAPGGNPSATLYDERYLVVARRGHPRIAGSIDLDTFCSLDHVVVSPQGGGFVGATDRALKSIGRRRRVALSTPGFLVVPDIVVASDMIALLPAWVARTWSARLDTFPPPLDVPGFPVLAVWHERSAACPVQHFVRRRLLDLPPP